MSSNHAGVVGDLLGQVVTMIVRISSRADDLSVVSCFVQKRQTEAVLVPPLAESCLGLSQGTHLARVEEERAQGDPVARSRPIVTEGPGNDVSLVTIGIGVAASLGAHVDEIVLAASHSVADLCALTWIQEVGSHAAEDGGNGGSAGAVCCDLLDNDS